MECRWVYIGLAYCSWSVLSTPLALQIICLDGEGIGCDREVLGDRIGLLGHKGGPKGCHDHFTL